MSSHPADPGAVRRTTRDDLAEQTPLGGIYLRRLVRAQLALSLQALLAFGGLVGSLPLALLLLPGLGDVDVLGIPLSLALVCVPLFGVFLGIGWLYQRRADALDVAFRDLVRDE